MTSAFVMAIRHRRRRHRRSHRRRYLYQSFLQLISVVFFSSSSFFETFTFFFCDGCCLLAINETANWKQLYGEFLGKSFDVGAAHWKHLVNAPVVCSHFGNYVIQVWVAMGRMASKSVFVCLCVCERDWLWVMKHSIDYVNAIVCSMKFFPTKYSVVLCSNPKKIERAVRKFQQITTCNLRIVFTGSMWFQWKMTTTRSMDSRWWVLNFQNVNKGNWTVDRLEIASEMEFS